MKKVIKSAALGASFVALASTVAFAADLNLNIYGASAQGKFWGTEAKLFLEAPVASGGAGCTSTTVKGTAPGKSKLGITVGQTCALAGGDRIFIRYTEDKSVEGPRSVMNLDPTDVDTCVTGDPTHDGMRLQADWDGSAFSAACKDVTVGASDVASESFTQESHGNINGNYDDTSFDQVLSGQVIPGATEIGTAKQPIIVPFSFFANKELTNPVTNPTLKVDHINRQQAMLLFSGNVYNYNQFGPGFPNKKVVLCMRHAGSGTHATLDKAILRGDRSLPTEQALSVPPPVKAPGVMFHESSSDLMKCVQNNGDYSLTNAGAIGYADSDKPVGTITAAGLETMSSSYNNVVRLGYNGGGEGMTEANKTAYGYSALKNEIINGSYEFWASQWMYIDARQETAETVNLFNKMMDYAAGKVLTCDGTNNLGCYWLTASQLKAKRELDTTAPHF